MNHVTAIHTDYIRASRTIETVLLTNDRLSKVFYIYNYEGISFRVFHSHVRLIQFFQNRTESDDHFESEDALDGFLAEVDLTLEI